MRARCFAPSHQSLSIGPKKRSTTRATLKFLPNPMAQNSNQPVNSKDKTGNSKATCITSTMVANYIDRFANHFNLSIAIGAASYTSFQDLINLILIPRIHLLQVLHAMNLQATPLDRFSFEGACWRWLPGGIIESPSIGLRRARIVGMRGRSRSTSNRDGHTWHHRARLSLLLEMSLLLLLRRESFFALANYDST